MMNTDRILEPKISELQKELGDIELGVLTQGYTLADAIREGASVANQNTGGWYNAEGDEICTLTAAYIALRARKLI